MIIGFHATTKETRGVFFYRGIFETDLAIPAIRK